MHNNDATVDPYELLGLDHATCTVDEVKRVYRGLALICHPDRGGKPDDMRILQTAYKWVLNQIQEVQDRTLETYEQKEQNFKDFLEAQQDVKIVPLGDALIDSIGYTDECFDELYEKHKLDSCEMRKNFTCQWVQSALRDKSERNFYENRAVNIRDAIEEHIIQYNKTFLARDMWHASVPHGYGEFMEKDGDQDDASRPVKHSFGKQEMILYEEPQALPSACQGGVSSISPANMLDDYSCNGMADYCSAYKEPNKELLDTSVDTSANVDELLAEHEAARQLQITYIGQPKDITALFKQFKQQVNAYKA